MKNKLITLMLVLFLTLALTSCSLMGTLKNLLDFGNGNSINKEAPYIRDGDTVYLGTYPQTEVTDEKVISLLEKKIETVEWISYNYYINESVSDFMKYTDVELNGEKYRCVYFTSYRPEYTDEEAWEEDYRYQNYFINTVYYFKYEPIAWKILEENDDTAMIVSDMIIDSQAYQNESFYNDDLEDYYIKGTSVYGNNYEKSTIRQWLNETFYNTAFTDLEKEAILITIVDNSAKSTGDEENPCACNDTNDKLFLLSFEEIIKFYNPKYNQQGFFDMQKKPTDYSLSQGTYIASTGNGSYWLRSPGYDGTDFVIGVLEEDDGAGANYTSFGVVPSLTIRLYE